MTYTTIVQVEDVRGLIAGGAVLVLDCAFDLGDPYGGRAIFGEGHLPGARYLDLERDMSGEPSGSNGRHPLPDRAAFAETVRGLGLHAGQQVVVYDDNGGIYAARAWWMLRWLGHGAVAVLDGGRKAWVEAGLPLEKAAPTAVRPGDFVPGAPLVGAPVTADALVANLATRDLQVIDARDPARFGGTPHPLDTMPGHIPGASNRFYRDNLDADGRFRSPAELAAEFAPALAGKRPDAAVLQCGSGVTACHNALALEIAGLPGARLYPGSWSEWTSDPSRPVER